VGNNEQGKSEGEAGGEKTITWSRERKGLRKRSRRQASSTIYKIGTREDEKNVASVIGGRAKAAKSWGDDQTRRPGPCEKKEKGPAARQ